MYHYITLYVDNVLLYVNNVVDSISYILSIFYQNNYMDFKKKLSGIFFVSIE